jgi:hypothetical protein
MTFAGTMNDDSGFGLTPFDMVLGSAIPRPRPPAGLVQLWEQGFAGQVVLRVVPLTPTLATLPVWTERVPPAIKEWIDAASLKRSAVSQGFNVDVKLKSFKPCRTAPVSLTDKEQKLRTLHLQRWLALVMLNPSTSLVGQQLSAAPEADALDIVGDVFYDCRTATLGARVGSLWIYVCWCKSIGMADADIVPVCEGVAYAYCRELALELAPATRASRFREAVALAQYLLGMDHSETLASRRVSGSALKSFERKRLLRQRDPLTCPMVHLLELIVLNDVPDASTEDRIVAGHALFLVFTRARHMDAQYVFEEPVADGPYLEAVTLRTKTSNAKGKRRKKLTLVGLSQGLADRQWAPVWLRLRSDLGLSSAADQPLLPLPIHEIGDGLGWSAGEVTSFDMGLHLRHIFVKFGFDPSALKGIGSHSLKATMLSWAAKGGLAKDDRRILGYHADGNDRSVSDYARDVFAEPLRALVCLVGKIAGGLFDPDASRSGLWTKEVVEEGEPTDSSAKCAECFRLLPHLLMEEYVCQVEGCEAWLCDAACADRHMRRGYLHEGLEAREIVQQSGAASAVTPCAATSDGELSAVVPRSASTNSFELVALPEVPANATAEGVDKESSDGFGPVLSEPLRSDCNDSSPTLEEDVADSIELIHEEDVADSSSWSASSSEEQQQQGEDALVGEEDEANGRKILKRKCSGHAKGEVWLNVSTGSYHYGHSTDGALLACCRPIAPSRHEERALSDALFPRAGQWRCRTCFGAVIEDGEADALFAGNVDDDDSLLRLLPNLAPES